MKSIMKERTIALILVILITYNINAQTWEEIGFNLPEGDTASYNPLITFTNKDTGWVFTYTGNTYKLFKTTNGGKNWKTIITEKHTESGSLALYSMEPDFFYMIEQNSKALFTTDGGITWDSTVINNAGFGCSALYFFNEQEGITFDDHSWITTDGGKNWERKGEISAPIDVYFYNDKLGWAVSSYNPFSTDVGYIAKTTDGGSSWRYQDSAFGGWGVGYFGIDFLDSLKGFAVGGDAGKTIDGGNNWQTISGVGGYDVGFLDDKNGWISSAGQIYSTSDGGETWEAQFHPLKNFLFKKIIILKKAKVAYVLGVNPDNNATTLLCADLSALTDIKGNKNIIPNKFALYQNYPNPFNPTTIIKYSLPTDEKVVMKVYDILGREIAALVNEIKTAGTYSVQFDGSNLSSGVYFYSITAGANKQVKKMLLAK